ncbi:MAG TPA: transposase [Terriglobales bacterium]|nr:transposase [Terriglobales bacterium]
MDDDTGVKRVLRSTPEVLGEVMPGLERRRRWSLEEKLRILAQSVAPGSFPTLTCKLHGISSGQLYTWRKQFRSGELTGFVPVSVAPEPAALPGPDIRRDPSTAESAPEPTAAGLIEVELPTGVKLRVPSDAGEAALRRIFAALS